MVKIKDIKNKSNTQNPSLPNYFIIDILLSPILLRLSLVSIL